MIRKTTLFFAGALLGAGVVVGLTQSVAVIGGAANAATPDTYRQLNLFGDVFERIRSDYVEEPEDSKLVESAINGMLSALDPHSTYLNAKSYKDMQVQTRGEFGGLGIEITMENEFVKVVSPIDDTPASRAGVQPNDIILAIDGESIQGLSLNEAVEKMRGPVNTSITLTLRREGTEKPIEVKLVRATIRIQAVRSRAEGDVGYVRLTQFSEQTTEGLKAAIEKLTAEIGQDKLKGFILDLRNNPGGLLDEAVTVSDSFLDHGEIVSTRGRHPQQTKRYDARPGDLAKGQKLIVLVNGGSASASEIVAGALQDHKRATVLGSRSFGKGSVQTVIPLASNGAIRMTTARYYTPSGRSIQAKGIVPDIELIQDLPPDQGGGQTPRGEASLRGHLQGAEGEASGSPAYVPQDPKNDTQLKLALDLLRGVQVNSAFPADPKAAVPN